MYSELRQKGQCHEWKSTPSPWKKKKKATWCNCDTETLDLQHDICPHRWYIYLTLLSGFVDSAEGLSLSSIWKCRIFCFISDNSRMTGVPLLDGMCLHVLKDCDHPCNIIYFSFLHSELHLVVIQSDLQTCCSMTDRCTDLSVVTTFDLRCMGGKNLSICTLRLPVRLSSDAV